MLQDFENRQEQETKNTGISVGAMTRIALVTAVFCALGPIAIPIPISPVPISLTNFVIFTSVLILEWKQATISCLLYLVLGAMGLPVFSGFSGGPAKLAGPTGGYLIGFIALVIIAGLFVKLSNNKTLPFFYFAGVILGEAVMYIAGTAWLSHVLSVSFTQGLFIGVIPYLPGDAAKMVLAFIVGKAVRGRIKTVSE